MKNCTLLLLVLYTLAGCDTKKGCEEMKTGTFSYGEDVKSNTEIVRNSQRQIEINTAEGFRDEYFIYWTSACNYFLVLDTTNKPSIDYTLTREDTMRVEITKTNEKGFDFYARLGKKTFSGEMLKQSNDTQRVTLNSLR